MAYREYSKKYSEITMNLKIKNAKKFPQVDKKGNVKPILSVAEYITYQKDPLDFFILLARYKFAARLLKKTDNVIDVGCSHGLGTIFMSKFAKHVVGADYYEDVIKDNKQRYDSVSNISFINLDILNISSHKAKYDAVISLDVIEHFTTAETKKVAENYAKLTRDGGFALIGTPNINSRKFASARRLRQHLHEFDPAKLESLLSKYFKRVFIFSMTDEVVSLTFPQMAWYLMAICIK